MIGRWLMNKILDLVPVWLQVALGLFLFIAIAWSYINSGRDAAFILHNHTDRPISVAMIDDIWIGNASAFNGYSTGSGVICCAHIDGKTVTVKWRWSITGKQYNAGLRAEDKAVDVGLPDRSEEGVYLHVHIFTDDIVKLFWSQTMQSKFQVIRGKEALNAFFTESDG